MKEFTSTTDTLNFTIPMCPCDASEILFFDIETTGFAPASTTLYLIGCAYFSDGKCRVTQWFADTSDSERDVITAFLGFASRFKALVHYNGSGFDIPYIIKKCRMLDIPCDFSGIQSIDIYKKIQPFKMLFKLENIKQKSVEGFLGISREDKYTGGELIKIYNDYLSSRSEELLELLLTHNREDVLGVSGIAPIMSYGCIADKRYSVEGMELRVSPSAKSAARKEVVINLLLDESVPMRVSYGNEYFYITMFENKGRICVSAHTDELKYFYPNYRDYYYLPEEDRSVHKSVAFYVDKNYRTQAKAANCYSKKTGIFLPQYEEIISPYFKIDYRDKITFFEYTEDFRGNPRLIGDYAEHIIRTLLG
ncbi:MAG: ribonuclease H-like domain-containing protein [Butyrivibrio sp.]|nr:ribonuclease H-like domain-containing protein [Butyrivibrio sp.]